MATGGATDAQTVYLALRAEIRSGGLAPGEPLREVALARRFEVSRTPVREALRRLQQDRLVRAGQRGMEVRSVDAQEVLQVYDLRILLEADAAGQAAVARGVADLARLDGLLGRDRALVDPDDATRTRTNLEFHEALWQATHNPVLIDLLDRLSIHLIHTPRSTLSVGDRWSAALDEHGRLVEAVRARDESGAREIAGGHMTRAREIRLALLREVVDPAAALLGGGSS